MRRACCLGESLVLGRSFSECDSTYEVVVEEVDIESISSFLPGGMGRRKLEWLLDICMPSNLDRRIRVKTAAKTATIGKGKSESYLGFSTYA